MTEKRTSAGKKAVDSNVPTGSGKLLCGVIHNAEYAIPKEVEESKKQTVVKSDYTGYFYNQIDRLWKEIMILQEANDKLRASISGGP